MDEPNRDRIIADTRRLFQTLQTNLERLQTAWALLMQGDPQGAAQLMIYAPMYQRQAEYLNHWLVRFIAIESLRILEQQKTGTEDPFQAFIQTLDLDATEKKDDEDL